MMRRRTRPELSAPSVTSKLPDVGVTIFTVMSRLAAEVGAVNLSQGFPDFDCDPELSATVARHMREGRNQYAPMQGALELREALSRKYEQIYGVHYDPATETTVTSGGTEAIFDAVTAVVRGGDEVLLFEPCYDSYVPAVRLNGATPIFVGMQYPDYAIDWHDVRRALTPRT
jgi:methionine aminotransferase